MKFCKPLATSFTLAFSQMPIPVSKEVKAESATETILQRWFLRVGTSGRISGRHGTGCFAQLGEQQAL